jgi:hypothetical protein
MLPDFKSFAETFWHWVAGEGIKNIQRDSKPQRIVHKT